jgi:hypothetical protein
MVEVMIRDYCAREGMEIAGLSTEVPTPPGAPTRKSP